MNITVAVEFNEMTATFTAITDGVDQPFVGFKICVPYNPSEPSEIRFTKKNPAASWNFRLIGFGGAGGTPPFHFSASWRTVTQNEIFPYTVVDVAEVDFKVQSFVDDEIVIIDTNRATESDIIIPFQISIFDTADGKYWTSPDPQIIDKKETDG